jgi:hypothetical protein
VVLREQIHFPGLQGGKALLGGEGDILDLAGVPQYRGGHGAAHVHVEPGPGSLGIRVGEPGQAVTDPALHESLLLDGIQRTVRPRIGCHQRQRHHHTCLVYLLHVTLPCGLIRTGIKI